MVKSGGNTTTRDGTKNGIVGWKVVATCVVLFCRHHYESDKKWGHVMNSDHQVQCLRLSAPCWCLQEDKKMSRVADSVFARHRLHSAPLPVSSSGRLQQLV